MMIVVRHSCSVWNRLKRVTGQLDPDLDAVGEQQACALDEALRGDHLDAVHSSPSRRAIRTARPTAEQHEVTIRTHDGLRELHFGVLQGRYRDQRDPEAQALYEQWRRNRSTLRLPGGESLGDLEVRVTACLDRISAAGGTSLVVTHANVVRVVLGTLLGWSRDEYADVAVPHHTLFRVTTGAHPTLEAQRFYRATGAGAAR